MADKSLLEEVESELKLKPVDTTWWIFRVLSIRLVIVFVACVFFALGLDANGVTSSYMFGWAAFLVCLGLIVFKND